MMPLKARRTLVRAIETGRMTEKDVAAIKDFLADLQITASVSQPRIKNYVEACYRIAPFLPSGSLVDASAADLYEAIAALKGPTAKGETAPYAASTLEMTITAIKVFYLWLVEHGYSDIPVQRIERIKAPAPERQLHTAGDMLTPEEVQRIADACRRSIDRAILWTLYEGGIRVGALTSLQWRQVTFDRHGCVLNIDDKTDKPRYVRLIMAAKPLAAWRADYPGDPAGDAYVFLSVYGRPYSTGGIDVLLKRVAIRAGVSKRIFPHLFRHSRVTHLIRENVNESVIKLMMWGNLNTPMLKTYTHLTGVDIDAEMLRTYGIAPAPEMRSKKLAPIQCPECKQIWPAGWRVCECGEILDETLKQAALDKEKYAQESGEYQKILAQLRRDLRIEDR